MTKIIMILLNLQIYCVLFHPDGDDGDGDDNDYDNGNDDDDDEKYNEPRGCLHTVPSLRANSPAR